MKKESTSNKNGWVVMLVLSILFFVWTIPLLLLSGGQIIFEDGLKYAGSTFNIGIMDKAALGYVNMSMLKPLWEELWIGILGIYCAFSLKGYKKHAWTLGLFWGVMLITNAAIQGTYEIAILSWPSACLQTYLFLLLGFVAVASQLITRKNYIQQSI